MHVREQSYNRKFPEWNLKFPALEKLMIEGTNLLSSQQLQDVVARCSMVRKSNSYAHWYRRMARWRVTSTEAVVSGSNDPWDGGDRACILQISYHILRGARPKKNSIENGNAFYLLPEHMEVSSWGQ